MGIKDVKMRVLKWERESDMIIENKNNGERERERDKRWYLLQIQVESLRKEKLLQLQN